MSKIAKFGGEMLKKSEKYSVAKFADFVRILYIIVLDCMIVYCHNCFTCGNKPFPLLGKLSKSKNSLVQLERASLI